MGEWRFHEQRKKVDAKIQTCHCHLYMPQAHILLREISHYPGVLTSFFGYRHFSYTFYFLIENYGSTAALLHWWEKGG